jgi:hypothetical protein
LLPSNAPTKVPTQVPTQLPTNAPSTAPTKVPTQLPTSSPSSALTKVPTNSPSNAPTQVPTQLPTNAPSNSPTKVPTHLPTNAPSNSPTQVPTQLPTNTPSNSPTKVPSHLPTNNPTRLPSNPPSSVPTRVPTLIPTNIPSNNPTRNPTKIPTSNPTKTPTRSPTECGTAIAYDPNTARCFSDIIDPHTGQPVSSQWGWALGQYNFTNKFTYPMTFSIYAGAGGCDITNGILVGFLTVARSGLCNIIITYSSLSSVGFTGVHLYVGTDEMFIYNGQYSTSWGQYPYTNETSSTSYSFNIGPFCNTNFYITAHAVVCNDALTNPPTSLPTPTSTT